MSRITCIVLIAWLVIPCISNAEKMKVIHEIGRLVVFDNGVVRDLETGLDWIAGSDKATTYDEAKRWVESLNKKEIASGGWRMPTIEELRTLYQRKERLNLTTLLKTSAWWIWSGEDKGDGTHWDLNFRSGTSDWHFDTVSRNWVRCFAVRSRK